MKLRNKKTGEIVDAVFYAPIGCYEITIWKDEDYLNPNSTHSLGIYKSLTELNEEWEDYKPAEPLIKDEKVRKAVRAWADKANIEIVRVDRSGSCLVNYPAIIQYFGTPFSELKNREYTIAELCGEEEE